MTDTMMTMIMTVMADVVEEDVLDINTRITHFIRFTHFIHSTHHSTANHTTVHTATKINKEPTLEKRNGRT